MTFLRAGLWRLARFHLLPLPLGFPNGADDDNSATPYDHDLAHPVAV